MISHFRFLCILFLSASVLGVGCTQKNSFFDKRTDVGVDVAQESHAAINAFPDGTHVLYTRIQQGANMNEENADLYRFRIGDSEPVFLKTLPYSLDRTLARQISLQLFGERLFARWYRDDANPQNDGAEWIDLRSGKAEPITAEGGMFYGPEDATPGNLVVSRDGSRRLFYEYYSATAVKDRYNPFVDGPPSVDRIVLSLEDTAEVQELDEAAFGIDFALTKPVPFLIPDGKKVVYLAERDDTETFYGLIWRYDFTSDQLTRFDYAKEHELHQFTVHPLTEQLIGISARFPDVKSSVVETSASSIHLFDFFTNEGRILLENEHTMYQKALLSPDATRYAYSLNVQELVGEDAPDIQWPADSERTWAWFVADVAVTDSASLRNLANGPGEFMDWIDDEHILIWQDGDMVVHNIQTQEEIILGPGGVDTYIGVVEIP